MLNKSFEEQNDDSIKPTMFLYLGKESLSNVNTVYILDGESWLSENWRTFSFYKLNEKDVVKTISLLWLMSKRNVSQHLDGVEEKLLNKNWT